ncbi:MAG: hypothetical protein J6H18_06110 [Lachnospiraceae bacterium]|nr:hypothetical protein [Lachnospiraceae bacterium]
MQEQSMTNLPAGAEASAAEREKQQIYDRYIRNTHTLGRILSLFVLILLLGAPFLMGSLLGARPNFSAAMKAFLSIGVVYLISCIAEYIIYVPMLGAGGTYLAFMTGNLINMKIPCAITARDMVGAKSGTTENEIISTLSIATSSLVTILVLAAGVALLIPLQPLLQNPALQSAFDNVVPALFGAMACKYFRGHLRIALPPLAAMSLLFILLPGLISSASMMIIPGGALAIALAYYEFKKAGKEGV